MTRETKRTLEMIERCGRYQQGDPASVPNAYGNDNVSASESTLSLDVTESLFPAHLLPNRSDWGEAA